MPCASAPGAARAYSRSGFMLLGRAIQRATGQSYGDFTSGDTMAWHEVSALAASGGLYSTCDDLQKWVEELGSAAESL